jgi:hypothetical protein
VLVFSSEGFSKVFFILLFNTIDLFIFLLPYIIILLLENDNFFHLRKILFFIKKKSIFNKK